MNNHPLFGLNQPGLAPQPTIKTLAEVSRSIQAKFRGWNVRHGNTQSLTSEANTPKRNHNSEEPDAIERTSKKARQEFQKVEFCPTLSGDPVGIQQEREPNLYVRQIVKLKMHYRQFDENINKEIIESLSALKDLHTQGYPRGNLSRLLGRVTKTMDSIQKEVENFQEHILLSPPSRYPFTTRNPLPDEASIVFTNESQYRHFKTICTELVQNLRLLTLQVRQISYAHALLKFKKYDKLEIKPEVILKRIEAIENTRPAKVWLFLPAQE